MYKALGVESARLAAVELAIHTEVVFKTLLRKNRAIAQYKCVPAPIGCGRPALFFRDLLSRKEYKISGLCQRCQDKFFQ